MGKVPKKKNKLPTEIVLTYKVKHNYDLKNLPYDFVKPFKELSILFGKTSTGRKRPLNIDTK